MKLDSLASQNWFHGMIGKHLSEARLLQVKEKGTFLVRFSNTNRGEYVISFLNKVAVGYTFKHYRVKHNPAVGKFSVAEKTYESIADIINDQSRLKKNSILAKTPCKCSDFERIRTVSQSHSVSSHYMYSTDVNKLKSQSNSSVGASNSYNSNNNAS